MRGFNGVLLASLGLLGLVGCGADVGSAGAALYAVDASIVDRNDLFLDVSVDARPMTEAQLVALGGGLTAGALPIDLAIEGHELLATIRGGSDIVARWPLVGYEFANATHIDGEVRPPEDPVYVPAHDGLGINAGPLPDFTDTDLVGEGTLLIDFTAQFDRAVFEEPEVWENLNDAHPGCA